MKASRDRARIFLPLSAIRGIGPAREKSLNDLGFFTVKSLLQHLPVRYEDRSNLTSIGGVEGEGDYSLEGELSRINTIFLRRRTRVVRALLRDNSGEMPVAWFNQPYIASRLVEDTSYYLFGRVRRRSDQLELLNPICETAEQRHRSPEIQPIYRSIGPIGSKLIAGFIRWIFENIDLQLAEQEWVPANLLRKHQLPSLETAMTTVHCPVVQTDTRLLNKRASPAHKRLIYAELLQHQLEIACIRARQGTAALKTHSYRVDRTVWKILREIIPFKLTVAQDRVVGEILDDLQQPEVMMRLLQGDVGSGKTIIAVVAAVAAMESGLQVAFMAPTELLAYQHFRNLRELLKHHYQVALLTSSVKGAAVVRQGLAKGLIQLVVGTHALIQESVEIPMLGLAIVDEQHRFGVSQRRALQQKGGKPDLLIMTATPIPRSFALTVYGDLSRSTVDELPPGRIPVETVVIPREARDDAFARLRRRLDKGEQAFVVYPFIDSSDQIEAGSIESEGASARTRLSGFTIADLHGRLLPDDREQIMDDFSAGRVQVILATTIVEVGLDVSNATVMVIESAERFGLAQLHQLRGRVGRGTKASLCMAIHGKLTESAARRLAVFASTADGFEIAEADLQIRGPGDVLGTRQTGLPSYRIADLTTDLEWLEKARTDARKIWAQTNDLECARVRAVIESRVSKHRLDLRGG